MRKSTKVALGGALLIGFSIVAGNCTSNVNEPIVGETTQEVTGPWLYLPLSKIGSDVNGYYGWNIASQACRTHYAEDLTGSQGDPVLAAADGNVLYAGPANDGTGLSFVTLSHSNGYTTKYYHLQNAPARTRGDPVARGTKVGEISSPLGGYSHVHFAVRQGTDNINGCTLSNTTGGCVDPGDPPGMTKSSSCSGDGHDPGQGMWVTDANGVVVLASAPTGNATVNVRVYAGAGTISVTRNNQPQGSTSSSKVFSFNVNDSFVFSATPVAGYTFVRFCGDEPNCSLATTANPFSGKITASSGNVYANFRANSPSCPTGSNWHLAGNYCWNEPGMSYTSASHLYNCQSAGGSAGDLGNCGEGCHDEPVGVNDICYSAYCPTGGYWYGAGLYCGRASGMSNANPDIVYNCGGAGAKASIYQVCSAACVVAPPGYNDHC